MQAVGRYVLVNDINEEIETELGLILGKNEANAIRYAKAEVVAAGEIYGDTLKKGAIVYYDKSRAHKINVSGHGWVTVIKDGMNDIAVIL